MHPAFLSVLVFVGLLLVAPPGNQEAYAAVYVCRSDDGGRHFTNTPTSDNCVVFKRKKVSVFSSGKISVAGRSRGGYRSAASYDSHINHYGSRYRVDPNLIKAVIRTESDFNQYAVSRRGARGLMQLMPETARELNVADPFNPGQNIEGGTRYLRYLLDTFNDNLTLTLAAYNAGPTLVRRVQRVPRIPETVAYVERVLGYYRGYSRKGAVADAFRGATIKVSEIVTVQ